MLHDIELVWPLEFTLDWHEHETSHGPRDSASCGSPRVVPTHVSTTLLGLVPVPLSLVTVSISMAMHDDGAGWDLIADVSALAGVLRLIRYEGPMRGLKFRPGGEAEEGDPRGEAPRFVEGFHHLLIYDGVCNLCNATVDFVARHDSAERVLFVPRQSAAAAEALQRAGHSVPELLRGGGSEEEEGGASDTVLLLTPDGELHQRSAAALRVGLVLDRLWPLALAALLVPSPLRDAVYRLVGRNRYRWFGRRETCRMPSDAERRRFLQ